MEFKRDYKTDIIVDYCRYCKDLNLNYIKMKNKRSYISNFMINYAKFNGLKNFSRVKKIIEMILKYNNSEIKKEFEKIK